MDRIKCPQCGYEIDQQGTVRCPRCNKLLLAPCNGNCSSCKIKTICK